MNVQGAWAEGITGQGVVVTILDDGLEKDHPDLLKNYVSKNKQVVIVWLFSKVSVLSSRRIGFKSLSLKKRKKSYCWNCTFSIFCF